MHLRSPVKHTREKRISIFSESAQHGTRLQSAPKNSLGLASHVDPTPYCYVVGYVNALSPENVGEETSATRLAGAGRIDVALGRLERGGADGGCPTGGGGPTNLRGGLAVACRDSAARRGVGRCRRGVVRALSSYDRLCRFISLLRRQQLR